MEATLKQMYRTNKLKTKILIKKNFFYTYIFYVHQGCFLFSFVGEIGVIQRLCFPVERTWEKDPESITCVQTYTVCLLCTDLFCKFPDPLPSKNLI